MAGGVPNEDTRAQSVFQSARLAVLSAFPFFGLFTHNFHLAYARTIISFTTRSSYFQIIFRALKNVFLFGHCCRKEADSAFLCLSFYPFKRPFFISSGKESYR